MRKLAGLFIFILFISSVVKAQDSCSIATALCANSKITTSNFGATVSAGDPALSCGDHTLNSNVWFTVTGISNGTATITVSKIDSTLGLEMEVYTGTCGSLVTTGQCATGVGPNGSMSVTFSTTIGTVYYIMVNGTGGNQESFDILATSASNSIVARPDADFNANPGNGCVPLSVQLQNTSIIFGGTNITYQWQFDAGPFVPSNGADTTVLYNTVGTHTVILKVCNNECGCKAVLQDVVAQQLVPSIGFSPSVTCIGTPVQFNGSAVILPNPPFVNPDVTAWSWNFGDPNSGVNNTASTQNPTHTFVGPGNSFNVRLIVQGVCGPDTANLTVTLRPKAILHPSADQVICQGSSANLTVTVDSATSPIAYNWSGAGTITCASCDSVTVTGLAPGGPYTFTINVMDKNGCVADSLTHVTVNPTPAVTAGNDTEVCKYTVLTLSATVTTGTGPFIYAWSPASGLNDSTLKNPTATITGPITYCVIVKDGAGCKSAPACMNITVFPKPTIAAVPTSFCSSDPGPYHPTFTVNGAHSGSTYKWKLSSNYSLITGTNVDSSVIAATLPTGVIANYNFTVIVNDPVAGCGDTVSITLPVISGVNLSVNGPFTICPGGSATLIASGASTYAWTASPSYVFVDPTQAIQNVSTAVTTIFIVKGTQGSCSKTDSILVTVHPKPVVNAGNDTTVCRYTLLTLTPTVTTGVGPFTYIWSPVAGLNDSTLKNPTADITGLVTYCVSVKDAIGCMSDTNCININIYPKSTISSSQASYCASDPGPDTTTFTVSGAHALSTYRWKLSPNYSLITGTNADSSSIKVTFPTGVPMTYNFIVIVNDPVTGCADTVPVAFTVTNGISMTVNGPFTICSGNSVLLTASGATKYAWTAIPSYVFIDSTQANQNVSPSVTTVFIVKGITGSCTQVDTIHVTVNPLPIANALSISPFCGCATFALNGAGSSPGMNYLWTSAGGSFIAAPDSQFTTATACASDVFMLTVTDPTTGCSNSASTSANSLPKAAAAADVTPSPICNGATITVALNGTGSDTTSGTTYQWSSTPVVSISNSTALNTTATVTGFTVFYLTVTTVLGCDSIAIDTVNIYPVPTISVSPGSICTSSPSKIDTVSINGASPGSTYSWTSIPPCVLPNSTSAQSQAFSFSSCGVGSYSFTVVVTDAVTGCVTTLNTSVSIVNGVALVTSPNQAICEGDSVVLFASGANSYLWSNNATTDTIVVKGLTIAMSPDTFVVAGAVGSCIAVDTIIVTINPTPVTSPIKGTTNVCAMDTATIFSVAGHAGDTYTWTVTGGTITSGQGMDSIVVQWGSPGPATITVHETNSFGCISANQALNVTVNPNPVTSPITGDTTTCANSTDPYSVIAIAGSSYQWSVSGGVITGASTGNSVSIIWGAGPRGTVSVVESNMAACSGDTVFLNVIIFPLPAKPVIAGPDTLCADSLGVIYSVANNPGSTWSWNVSGGSITKGQGTDSITVNWGGVAGSDTIQVTETNANGCISPADTMIVILDSVPVTSPIIGNKSVCLNDSDIYIVTNSPGDTYTWTVTGGGISSGQGTDSIKVNWGSAGLGTVTVSEANSFGCKGALQTLNVTINPKPSTSPISGDTMACQNSMQPYTVIVTPGSTYQWTAVGGTISGSSTDTMVSVIWGVPPAGTIKVVETSAVGCVGDTVTLNVTILAAPVMPVISGADSLCANTLGAMDSVPNNIGSYYLWTVTGGTIVSPNDSTNKITVNWGNPGTDTIRVVEVNANACPSLPATLIVTIDSVPVTSSIVGDTSECANDTAAIYSVTNHPGNIYNWTVAGGSITSGQGTDSIKVNWTGPAIDTITVLETAPGGCSGLQQLLLVIHTIPDSTKISGQDSVCAGTTTSYTVTGDTGSTFLWTASNGIIVGSKTGSIISVTWGTPGTGLLQVTETSRYGCNAAPVFLAMVINPIPNTSPITGNDTVCISDTGNIYFVTDSASSIYTWSVVGGVIIRGQGTDSIAVNWSNSGADSITVVETSKYGCIGAAVAKIVVVTARPVATASASKITLCQMDSVQLTGADSNTVSVNWFTGGSGSFNNDTTLSPIYTAGINDSGIVVLTLVAHNPPCANDSAIITLTVNPIPHVTVVPAAPTICFGDSDTLVATGIGSYLWTPSNDTTTSIIVHPIITTTYTITVRNNFGCSSSDSVVVTVLPPGIATAGPDQSVCRGDSVHLNGSIANAGGGAWTSNGDGTFIPNAFTLNAIYVPGTNDTSKVQFILTTTGACLNLTDTLTITFNGVPTVNAGLDQTITYRDSAHLNGTVVNAGGGIWSSNGTGFFIPGDSTLNAIYVPSFTDLQQDSIVLTLTSTYGCKIVSDIMVIHFNDFLIPNVFTPYPNSPGYNDFFEIKGLPPDSRLKVWNRWGVLVYTSDNYRNDWDAAGLVSDVYYYVILTTKTEYHGWVEVIK